MPKTFATKVFVPATVGASARKNDRKNEVDNGRKSRAKLKGEEVQQFYNEILSLKDESGRKKQAGGKVRKKTEKTPERAISPQSVACVKSKIRPSSGLLFRAAAADQVEVVRQCLESISVNCRDHFGWTPLMTAVCAKASRVVEYLLENGADTEVKDRAGNTCLTLAEEKGYSDIAALIRLENKQTDEKEVSEESEGEKVDDDGEKYCDVCRTHYRLRASQHRSSTVHLLNLGPSSVPTQYGISEANRGFQMLLNSGWDRNGGLGPEGSGKKFPVKTVLKRDRVGLGGEGGVARVTHRLGPEEDAKNATSSSSSSLPRVERKATVEKRARERAKNKDARKERLFRQALWDL